MKRFLVATLGLVLAIPTADAQQRQTDRDFRWVGTVPSGRWLYVRNLNGSINVERARGNQVEITAEKSWRRGNPDDVTIRATEIGSGGRQDVLVCALWNEDTECDEDGYRPRNRRGRNDNRNDVAVEFTVRVPAGVRLGISTINGSVDIAGATAEIDASTVNGNVSAVSSGGPVRANTVNGNIEARMGTLGEGDLSFETVNGSVEVWVPDAPLDADVDMRTVNGQVEADFPMTVRGRINPRHIRATIGRGGRRIELQTVNGSVELRKG